MTMKTTKVNPKTPLGQVILEKREIRRLCQETEEKISADWQYIRSNAGRLDVVRNFCRPYATPGGIMVKSRAARASAGNPLDQYGLAIGKTDSLPLDGRKWDGKSLKVCSVVAAQSENTKNG